MKFAPKWVQTAFVPKCTLLKSLWFLLAFISYLVQICPTMSHKLCTTIDIFPIKWKKLSHAGYFKLAPNWVPSALIQKCSLSKSLWFLFAFISYLVQVCPTMSHEWFTAFEFFPIKWKKLSHLWYFKLAPNRVPSALVQKCTL